MKAQISQFKCKRPMANTNMIMQDVIMERVHSKESAEDIVKKADGIVVKRLRFVLKILKALTVQSNNRNRQGQPYIMEVLDAISDWSGNGNEELMELLNEQIYPQICTFISTYSKDEFNIFQAFTVKYLLTKWKETSSFAVLDFVGDIYAFITKIAPPSIVEEYIDIFSLDCMPPHITLIILPSILRNLPEDSPRLMKNLILKAPLNDRLIRVPRDKITEKQSQLVCEFWKSLSDSTKPLRAHKNIVNIISQCLVTSSYLGAFRESDLVDILEDFIDWGNVAENFHLEIFLIISVIFLSSCWMSVCDSSSTTFVSAMKNLFLLVGENSKKSADTTSSVFCMKVLQRILERSDKDWKEVVEQLALHFGYSESDDPESITDHEMRTLPSEQNSSEVLNTFEKCVKRIAFDAGIHQDEGSRKRIKLLTDELIVLLNKNSNKNFHKNSHENNLSSENDFEGMDEEGPLSQSQFFG